MVAGLTKAARYGRTVRALNKVERQLRALAPASCTVRRSGGRNDVVICEPTDAPEKGFSVYLSWGNMSAGGSVGCWVIAGREFWYGDFQQALKDAIAKPC